MLLALRVIIAARWLRRNDIFAYAKVLNCTVHDMNSTTCTSYSMLLAIAGVSSIFDKVKVHSNSSAITGEHLTTLM
jgi:hypothetical protein